MSDDVKVTREDREAVARCVFSSYAHDSAVAEWVESGTASLPLYPYYDTVLSAASRIVARMRAQRDAETERAKNAEIDLDDCRFELESMRRDLAEAVARADKFEGERDELREKLDKALVELEALKAKCAPNELAVKWASSMRNVVFGLESKHSLVGEATKFILSLAPQKRKTRLDAACESLGRRLGFGLFDESGARELLVAAGVNPDEELP